MNTLNSIDQILQINCPCGSGKTYQACCQMAHKEILPTTAEELMRSRFSAFALATQYPEMAKFFADYLCNTWDQQTRPESLQLETHTVWQQLKIVGRKEGKKRHSEGYVTFQAHFLENGQQHYFEEKSFFKKTDGKWFYVEGEILAAS